MRRALVSLACIAAAVSVVATIGLTHSGATAPRPVSEPALVLRAVTLPEPLGAPTLSEAARALPGSPAAAHHAPQPAAVQQLRPVPSSAGTTSPATPHPPTAAQPPAQPAAQPAAQSAATSHPSSHTAVREHTGWQALDDAIDQLPYWYPGVATFEVGDKGAWGATDLNSGTIWIAPRTPLNDLVSVVMHEYGHAITGRLYGGFTGAEAVADRYFGQQGEYGLEVEADCMARVEGATWTNYTPCQNSTWRAYAATLLRMQKLA